MQEAGVLDRGGADDDVADAVVEIVLDRVEVADASLTAAETDYGVRFTSVVARANIFAAQFHPEKSAAAGLRLLANFIRWQP